jgi:ABC-2 type transport system ATP-binding protein
VNNPDLADPSDAAVYVKGLTKRYSHFSLRGVSLTLPKGHILGLVGPNGAGKTTTIRCLLGLSRREDGTIRILGQDPGTDPLVKRHIAYVTDTPPLFPNLTGEQMAWFLAGFYPDWNDTSFRSLASRFDIPLQQRCGTLSRGNQMRLALSLALAHSPDLLILDEPTSSLDPVARRDFLHMLLEIVQDETRSVLLSTHLTDDIARIADYVAILVRGRVVASDETQTLLDRWRLVHVRIRAGVNRSELPIQVTGVHGDIVSGYTDRYSETMESTLRHASDGYLSISPMTLDDIIVNYVESELREYDDARVY